MFTFYEGCFWILTNENPFPICNGAPAPSLGVFEGPSYPQSFWAVSII